MFLPNTNRTQAAEITPGSDGMVPSAAAWRYLQRSILSLPGWWLCAARFLSLVTLSFDLWPWNSNLSERGTKHVFPVNLAQIRSAVPDILDSQTKKTNKQKSQTAQTTEPYAVQCMQKKWLYFTHLQRSHHGRGFAVNLAQLLISPTQRNQVWQIFGDRLRHSRS